MSIADYQEHQDRVRRHALALAHDQHPLYNLAPLIALIERAWGLGYDVCNKERPAVQPTEGQGK